ncbi:MAG: hypothetical protein M3Y08_09635 [Fibrobacterota bacterium]|nr:hypothetical protein [Fibrobacterota bacterium]
MGFLFPAVLLVMAIGVQSQTLEDSAGFMQADSFFRESQAKQRFPKFSVEAEPLRTLLWWGASNFDETEKDSATGKEVQKKEFPAVSPVMVVTQSINKTWSVMGTYLIDFQNLGGWGLGAGVNMSQSDEYLRGIYYGGKVYFLDLADYGYSFRAYSEIGSRILVLNHLSVGIGTAIGYGNNAIDESEGATLGIIGELHVRLGLWF